MLLPQNLARDPRQTSEIGTPCPSFPLHRFILAYTNLCSTASLSSSLWLWFYLHLHLRALVILLLVIYVHADHKGTREEDEMFIQ